MLGFVKKKATFYNQIVHTLGCCVVVEIVSQSKRSISEDKQPQLPHREQKPQHRKRQQPRRRQRDRHGHKAICKLPVRTPFRHHLHSRLQGREHHRNCTEQQQIRPAKTGKEGQLVVVNLKVTFPTADHCPGVESWQAKFAIVIASGHLRVPKVCICLYVMRPTGPV